MKKLFLFVLLFCLGLAGCSASIPAEAAGDPVLPTPEARAEAPLDAAVPVLETPERSTEPPRFDDSYYETLDASDFVSIWEAPDSSLPHVRGPAGSVRARFFLGACLSEPVYGDLDGDGEIELVYSCPGPTSGLWTEAICVYGLEEGWPVLKGCTVFNLSLIRDFRLTQEGGQVILRCATQKWDMEKKDYVDLNELRLPVTLSEGQVLLSGGELPENIQVWGYGWHGLGGSFSALKQRHGKDALLNHWSCLIWQESVTPDPTYDPSGNTYTVSYAAVTDNSVTVSAFLSFPPEADAPVRFLSSREGLVPIPPVEDLQALMGLTMEQLEERLGPCHFDMGSGTYIPCWFTEDGKLLIVHTMEHADSAELWDFCAGTPLYAADNPKSFHDPVRADESARPEETSGAETEDEPVPPEEADLVTVSSSIPTKLRNEARWERFLAATQDGQPDAVTLRMVFDSSSFDLLLSYDGEAYTLLDEGRSSKYQYLIVEKNDTPPAEARFRSAIYYLLSGDPDATWGQYMARMASSFAPIGVEETPLRGLFSVYE